MVIIFLQLNPWCSAYTANGVEELDVHVLLGEQTLDTLAISTSSYDENGDPLIRFADGKVNNSTLSTTPELFQLTAGIFGDDPIRVRIEQTSLGGTLDVSEQGVQLSNGYAQGYLSKPALLDFLVDLQNTCLSDNPPEICSLIASVLDNEAEEVLNLFVTLLGGYDTILQADGTATPCPSEDTAECNAMSLCTFVEFEALVLE